MMNILYISYDGATDPLGQSQVIPYLKKLSRQGDQFTLLTYDKSYNRKQAAFSDLKNELGGSGIKWVSLNYHKNPKVIAKIYDICAGIIVCAALLKRDKIVLIHGRSFVGAFIGLILKKFFGKRFLLDYRGLWPDERVDGGLWVKGSLLYKLTKYIEKLLLLSADQITVLTERAKQEISSFAYMKSRGPLIYVVPTCADLELFEPGKKRELVKGGGGLTLVYLGSLGTWYMLDEMVDFFVELRKEFRDSHFLFLTPAKTGIIIKAMQARSLPESCYSFRSSPYAEVPHWLSGADLSIFFIKPLFSKISSCPTKLGESLACGLPVVINSGIGDCDEIVGKNNVGVITDGFSLEAYKKCIMQLRRLWQAKEKLDVRCRKVAEDFFSLDRGVQAYRRIYNRLGAIE
ncbi:glycosyltransferase family 4 protein [Candidatus Omnitrophota bacterium]